MLSVIDINPKAGKALLMSLKNGAAANMLLRTFTVRKLYLSILHSNSQKLYIFAKITLILHFQQMSLSFGKLK